MARVDRMIKRRGIKQQLAVMNQACLNMFQRGLERGREEVKREQATALPVVDSASVPVGLSGGSVEYDLPNGEGYEPEATISPSA